MAKSFFEKSRLEIYKEMYGKEIKIQRGDIIGDRTGLGIIENFQRNGAWVQIHWSTFTDVYSTREIYKLLRDGEYSLYKKVKIIS